MRQRAIDKRRPFNGHSLVNNVESLALSDPIDESTLESICSHLVVLDSRLKVWKFPHASVAEYFENQHQSWTDNAPEDVAILLVSCLIGCYSDWTLPESDYETLVFLMMAPKLDNHLDPQHPLQKYARKYWVQHVQNSPNQRQEVTGLSEILRRFLGANGPQQSSSRQYQAWCRHMSIGNDLAYDMLYVNDIEPSDKSIFGICVFGLHKFLRGWWDEGIDVSQVNSVGQDLLAIAAKHGQDELCSELISRGSDINRELDSDFGSAFMEAICWSQIKTAVLLLDKGVNPNIARKGTIPLCWAVRIGKGLVEPLLEAGADPNIPCPYCVFGCALEAAAFSNDVHSAELLIRYGADVNLAVESRYGSPLGTAAYVGSPKCAKLFVDNGADVNAHLDGKYGSVLAAAIFGWRGIDMVKYLIEEAGADPAILSSTRPPRSPWLSNRLKEKGKEIAEYLIKGGHVQESVLFDIGFL